MAMGANGGKARAAVLTPAQRQEIARAGGHARWTAPPLRQATHGSADAPLRVGPIELPCYVLEDGTRVLSQRGMLGGLGIKRGGLSKGTVQHGNRLVSFLASTAMAPFVDQTLAAVVENPIAFRTPNGVKATGYPATVLVDICDAVFAARKAGALLPTQMAMAETTELLLRAFAKVGIIALIDEATGYQAVRDKWALQAVLDRFLRRELAVWAKRFPDEFYENIFRLRGWTWQGRHVNPPQAVAYYTKDLVYARLAPGILTEIEVRNPIDEHGRRRVRHHEWLSDGLGLPMLGRHLDIVISLMQISSSWEQFMVFLDVRFPRRGDTMQLPLMTDFKPGELPL